MRGASRATRDVTIARTGAFALVTFAAFAGAANVLGLSVPRARATPPNVVVDEMDIKRPPAGDGGVPLRLKIWRPRDAGSGPLPLVLYAHAWGGDLDEGKTLLSSLAQAGFLVAAVGRARPPGSFDFSSDVASARTQALADGLVTRDARDLLSVLDWLLSLQPGAVLPPIDAARLGIVGYSFGGAIAAEASHLDARLKAIVNIDGWLFGEAATAGFPARYLVFANSLAPPSAAELQSRDPKLRFMAIKSEADTRIQNAILGSHGGYSVEIPHAKHCAYVDACGPPRWLWAAAGRPSSRTAAIVTSYSTGFLLGELRGARGTRREVLGPALPGASARFWPASQPNVPLAKGA